MASKNRQLLILVLVAAAIGIGWYRYRVYSDPLPNQRPRLIVMTGGSSPYWQLIAYGAEAAAKVTGAELQLITLEKDEDVEAQTELFATMDPTQVDGIAISPLDAERQTRFINDLAEETVVVTIDSDAPLSNRLCYIGASNFGGGTLCARLVEEAIPDGGKVAVLVANLTKNNVLERKQALEEGLAGGDSDSENSKSEYEVVAVLEDGGDMARCSEQLTQLLGEHSDLACVVGLNSYHAAQIVKVLEELGELDQVKVVSFDTEDATLDSVEQGHIYATVAQDPYRYGYEAVRWLAGNSQRTGNQLPLMGTQSTVHISTRALRADDVPEFRKHYRELLGQAAERKTP